MQYEPFKDDRILESRVDSKFTHIRRRRESLENKSRYTTYEIKSDEYKKLETLSLENYQLKQKLKEHNKVLKALKKIINKEV